MNVDFASKQATAADRSAARLKGMPLGIAGLLLLLLATGACDGGDGGLTAATAGTDPPSTARPVDESESTFTAQSGPVTVEQLEGIWYEDSGTGRYPEPILARFATDGSFALGGALAEDSWLNGTYTVAGQRITFTATGGACGSRDTFAWDVRIVADGRLEGLHAGTESDQPGKVGGCAIPVGEPYNFTQISPTSPAATELTAGSFTGLPKIGPLTGETRNGQLDGYWLLEGTGFLLRWDLSGSYRLDDVGEMATNTQDAGTVKIGPSSLSFTSGEDSHGCAAGDVMVWENVEVDEEGLRGSVSTDSCGRGIADEMTWRLLGVDTP